MPLQVSTESPAAIAKALQSSSSKPSYLVVYASLREDGKSWCGDCRNAEPLVNEKFAGRAETVKVVYAGQKPEYVTSGSPFFSSFQIPSGRLGNDSWWRRVRRDTNGLTNIGRWRTDGNPWRQAPFLVTNLPTLIKVTGDVSDVGVEARVHGGMLTEVVEMGEAGGGGRVRPE